MHQRVSTALIAARDTLVPLAISMPFLLGLRLIVRSSNVPDPVPGVARVSQLLESMDWVVPAALAVSSLGYMVAGWWFRKHRPVAGWEPPPPRRASWGRSIGIGIGVGFLVIFLSALVGMAVARLFGLERVETAETLALTEATGSILTLICLLGVVVAPIGEELFFRGHLFRWSADRCGSTYAYALTATIFALVHFNPPGIPSYAVAAVILGWSYDRWRTLVVPIVAHMTMNGVTIGLFIAISRARPELLSTG